MKTRALDPETGDIVTSGKQFIDNVDAIAQTVGTRLKLFYGDYFRDSTVGFPFFQLFPSRVASVGSKNAAIREVILLTPGITEILRYESDFDLQTRGFTVNAEVMTTVGVIKLKDLRGF